MRIGIFSECYLPTLNGVVISIETFRLELEKRGHEIFVFAPATNGYVDRDNKHVFRYPSIQWPGQKEYPLALPIFSTTITKKIKDLKLDIIHAQHLFTMGNLGLRIARQLDIPIVYTYHTLIAEYTHYVPALTGISRKALISLSRDFCNKCDQIVTPSPSMAKILKSYGVKKPIEAIPTGIYILRLQNHLPGKIIHTQWDIPENRKILLYLSRIAKEKNIDFLLKAMKLLIFKRQKKFGHCDVHLLMVGGGPELLHYQQLARKMGIEEYVTFTGMIKYEVATKYYGAAKIFVFPSVTETQGIVVTEAMAAGTPVVAVNKMGPSDLIVNGEDGYLTGLNISEFSGKIEKLLDDEKLYNKMSQKAKINAENFSSETCSIKLENVYEQTIIRYRTK